MALIGERGGQPLDTPDGRPLPGQGGQDRGPAAHPAVLLFGTEQGEALSADRQRGRECSGPCVVHHPHVVPAGTPQLQAAQAFRPAASPTAVTPGAPSRHHRKPFLPGSPRHRPRGQPGTQDEDGQRDPHTGRGGLHPQHEDADDEPQCHRDDLAGAPPGQRAAPLARPEAVARSVPAHAPSRSPGVAGVGGGRGTFGGRNFRVGPWPSEPM